MEALPGALAPGRLVCRVRTFVGQDSNLVVRHIIYDTIGIVSHLQTGASLCRRLFVLPFVIGNLAFVICLFFIPYSEILLPHFPQCLQRSHQLAVPGRLAPAEPLERRAALERCAVGPNGVPGSFDDFVDRQQLLEPALVFFDDRVQKRPRRVRVARSVRDLAPDQPVVEGGIGARLDFLEVAPLLLGVFRQQHVPGKEEGIERRVVDRLDNIFALEPDEPEHFRHFPLRLAVQQVAVFLPALQQPAAAVGGFSELADEPHRVVGPERHPGDLDLFRPCDVQQPAAELANLRGLPCGDHLRLDQLAALDLQRQPCRLADQVALDVVPRLQIAVPLLSPLCQLPGISLRREGHDGQRGQAVFDCIATNSIFPLVRLRPCTQFRVASIGFNLRCAGHDVGPGEV